jgi:hypothetical protein
MDKSTKWIVKPVSWNVEVTGPLFAPVKGPDFATVTCFGLIPSEVRDPEDPVQELAKEVIMEAVQRVVVKALEKLGCKLAAKLVPGVGVFLSVILDAPVAGLATEMGEIGVYPTPRTEAPIQVVITVPVRLGDTLNVGDILVTIVDVENRAKVEEMVVPEAIQPLDYLYTYEWGVSGRDIFACPGDSYLIIFDDFTFYSMKEYEIKVSIGGQAKLTRIKLLDVAEVRAQALVFQTAVRLAFGEITECFDAFNIFTGLWE